MPRFVFGLDVIDEYLEMLDVELIVRAHQVLGRFCDFEAKDEFEI